MKNTFSALRATKKEQKRTILVSGNPTLIDKFNGKTMLEIGESLNVDPDTGVKFATKDINGNTLRNVILTGEDGVDYVFPLSRSIAEHMDSGAQISGAEVLDWEARKISVPVFERDDNGELVKTDQMRDSLNIGLPSGTLTFDEVTTFNSWDEAAIEPKVGGDVSAANANS